jgi:CRISPR system Cascade subunit CasB
VTVSDATTTAVVEFVGRLEALAGRGGVRADVARLRRCAGRMLGECPEVFQLFYRLLPHAVHGNEQREERYFLVATLYALNQRSSTARDFGATMSAVAASRGPGREGIDRRMAVLLDAPLDDLSFRLRQLVALAASQDIGINWGSLLDDLLWWDHPARRVQKRWARSYFGRASESEPSTTAANFKE